MWRAAATVDEAGGGVEAPYLWSTWSAEEWSRISGRAQPLPMSKFAPRHTEVQHEVLFFRGIAGENAHYLSAFGDDVTLTGY